MTGDELLLEFEEKMEASLNAFVERAKGMRSGRASPELLEPVKVEYYGSLSSLKQLATVQAPDGSLLTVKPFDPSALKAIEKAIATHPNLGLTPQNDGKIIRIPVPPMSQDRRQKMADQLKGFAEESRVAIRNVRRDAKKAVDDGKKAGSFPEDDAERLHEEVQKLTDGYVGKVDQHLQRKVDDILKI